MTYPSSSLIGKEPPCSYSVTLKSFLLAMFNGNTCVRFSYSPICLVSHLDDAHTFWFAVDCPHFGPFDLHY